MCIRDRTITNFVKFQCVQDKTTIIDRINIGDEVKVYFNIKGTKWEKNGNTNYTVSYTHLDVYKRQVKGQQKYNSIPYLPKLNTKTGKIFSAIETIEKAGIKPRLFQVICCYSYIAASCTFC